MMRLNWRESLKSTTVTILLFSGGLGRHQLLMVIFLGILMDSAAIAFWIIEPVFSHSRMVLDFDTSESVLARTSSFYFAGYGLGGYILGSLNDVYGRKPVLFASALLGTVASICAALVFNIHVYTACRFCSGLASGGIAITAHVFLMEFMVPKSRGIVGITVSSCFSAAVALISPIAYAMREFHWQALPLVLAIVPVLTLLTFPIFPESPHFLLKKGLVEEATAVLKLVAARNGVTDPLDIDLHAEKVPDSASASLSHLFLPSLRWKVASMAVCWFSVTLGYFGVVFEIGHLSGNMYMNNAIMALIEIPGVILCRYTQESVTFGRIGTQAIAFGSMAIALLITTTGVTGTTQLALATFGKFGAACGFGMIFTTTAEILPTSVRASGMGVCNAFGRIGGAIAPILVQAHPQAALGIFGACGAISTVLTLTLPETRGAELLAVPIEDMARHLTLAMDEDENL
eukprot:c18157_g1_i4.p1 GENE.c18157_g1_i4~~c18157_g1_i4.p1  ORF type:complete len:460 (-),score=57.65 c18157_g1_i4:92-1471(-)